MRCDECRQKKATGVVEQDADDIVADNGHGAVLSFAFSHRGSTKGLVRIDWSC